MKKSIFLFFAAILCAMTANAQWALMGTLTDWGSGKAMTLSGTTATCTVDLAGKTEYKLKVKNGGTWYGRNSTTITATTTTPAFSTSGGDVTLKSTFNGTYTFSFDTSSKKLTVTYPTEDKPVETHDITVKAKYPAGWNAGKAAIHFWGNGVTGTTPAAMTKDGDWWTYTVTGVPTTSSLSVIFINGSNWNGDKNQTVDITGITENTCFEVSQSGGAKGTAVKADCETGEGEVIETHDITIKAFYPAAWNAGKAAVHFWGDGVTGATPAAMTKDGDWWSYTVTGVPTTSELSVIFINGDNWNGDANQTVDITGIKESTCYQITSGSGKASAKVVDCASTPVVAEDVYTVVGSEVLLGTDWDLNNADNEMTKQDDGSYILVKENVDLAKTGTYEYKVVKNHDWSWSVPSGTTNNTLKLGNEDVDGTYNVTFTLNKELNALTASLELVEAKKVIPECYVAGDESLTGQNWNAKSVLMTYDEATEVYTATLTAVPAGTHNMKVVYGGEWLGFDHLATPAPANVKEGDDKKIQFTLAEAGDVTVTYHATNGIGLTGNFAVPETKYYIAGTENLTGFEWKENGLEIAKDGDVYKHTFSEKAAGTYEFKITDGTWTNPWGFSNLAANYVGVEQGKDGEGNPNGNIKIVTEEAKNIIVIFDPANNKITLEDWEVAAPATVTYVLMGVNGDWDNGIALTQNPGNEDEYVLENQVIIKATDAVKVVTLTDGTASAWCGNVDSYSNATYTADGSGNIVLEDGIYTFYFKKSTDNIYINQTGYARNVTNTWGTICLPKASSNFTGATFYEVSSLVSGEGLWLNQLANGAQLVAGKPYIFQATATKIEVTYTGEAVGAPIEGANGLTGTFTGIAAGGLTGNYIIAENKVWVANDKNTLPANRAYISSTVPTTAQAEIPGRRRVLMGENAATGVDNIIAPEGQAVKAIVNGQLIIIRDGVKYNVQGQKL